MSHRKWNNGPNWPHLSVRPVIPFNVRHSVILPGTYRVDGVDVAPEMERKVSNSQACYLAQLCLAAA